MTARIDLLIVYCVDKNVTESLDNITNYPEMKTYFLHNEVVQSAWMLQKNIKFLFLPSFWLSKSKDKFTEFKNLANEQGIDISLVDDILFGLLGSLKVFKKNSLNELCSAIPGKIYKFEDRDVRCFENDKIQTIGHFKIIRQPCNFLDAGLTVAHDIFLPRQDFDKRVFKIHVDHDLADRENVFSKIKNIIIDIKEKISGHSHWQDLIVIYHDKEVAVEQLGNIEYDHLPIKELATLYGSCHLSFLSHRETLGQYPLEMLSCGVNVIARSSHILHDKLSTIDIDKDIDYDQLLDLDFIKESIIRNRDSVNDYSFKSYTDKILSFIFKE